MKPTIYSYSVKDISGSDISLSKYEGKVILIVNTASECGFTPQYQGLQSLYEQFGPERFVVLGFPCNQFGQQEKGSNEEIAQFCELNFGVSFPLFDKIEVNGAMTAPLFEMLKSTAKGIMGSQRIKWNFTKFLVDSKGEVVKRYSPRAKPESIAESIKKLLAES